ncbi:alpha-galactosidase [Streptococcus didelphis]|uniref:alpha-galactosidase n=1 Tax=Streptococcus didelphis TaxID=102886 RepID=UPI0003679D01|nr:alpha-galactosidase [Streptococcus didelphis]
MPIKYCKKEKEFHLYNDELSYVICLLPNGHVGNLYYGKRLSEKMSYSYLLEKRQRPLTACVYEDDDEFSLEHTRQEYAAYGNGDMALPAFEIKSDDGSRLSHFVFYDYAIFKGKPKLSGLPHTYAESDQEATSLELYLRDSVSETELCLTYTIYENRAVITRNARFTQRGEKPICLKRALSLCLDLPDKDYDWLHLDGAWGRERHIECSKLHQGCQSIYSLKGASSAEHNPFLALKRPQATEDEGEVLGFSLIYSGNFLAQLDVTPYDQTRISMGIHPLGFEWYLKKGESFQTPEVVMVYSHLGLNGMSQVYHQLYRQRLARGIWRDKERPILLNNWEALTFDFNETTIFSLAEKAADLGIELFVMDDGWFGQRNHDRAGLGDWTVNYDKLPHGLIGISQKVHELGMLFGLWIEPEMVNKDSQLYREHPDWIFHHPAHSQTQGRHQYTLDLSREDVYQNIYRQLHTLLTNHDIDYIKWDMNRYMTEVYSSYAGKERQGELFHRYILNLYRLYEQLTSEFPHILFESCSSGGARFDPGMLYYAPQAWTSDDTDAYERLKIQYGTSLIYPLISMGNHVSEVPNQQLARVTPLSTRTQVAYFGSFGYELDLRKLDKGELDLIKKEIAFYKNYRRVFQFGAFTRLISPFETSDTAWQVISEDACQVFVGLYRGLLKINGPSYERLRLKGLEAEASYRLNNHIYLGSALMNAGLVIKEEDYAGAYRDFTSVLYHLEKI